MSASELLAQLRALGVHVRVEGGRLRLSAPKGRVTPEVEAQLRASKDELLRLLTEEHAGESAGEMEMESREVPKLVPVSREGLIRLSSFQERLWILDRLQPGVTAYNLSAMAHFGQVRSAQVVEAVRIVVARHEILRTKFVMTSDGPAAQIGGAESLVVPVVDLRAMDSVAAEALVVGAVHEAAHTPFELSAAPPVLFTVYRLPGEETMLHISVHHIVLDAWSFSLLVQEIRSTLEPSGAPKQPPALQYADYAAWQRKSLEHPDAERRLAYWTKRLARLPQLSTFWPDWARAQDGVSSGTTFLFAWPESLYASVRTLARDSGATVYMVLVAAFVAVLHRHTGQDDLAIGSPVGTRDMTELETVIGPIVNPLVLRFDFSDDPTFTQLIARARDAVLDGHANQDVPFERIVQQLSPERSLGHSPLFQTAVVLHNSPDANGTPIVNGGAIYDVTLFASEQGGTLVGAFEYRSDLYGEASIRRIARHFERFVTVAASDPAVRVSDVPILGVAESSDVLEGFNRTTVALDRRTMVAQFDAMAAGQPDAVAVVDSVTSLTYRELADRSTMLAESLRNVGVGAGAFVAFATERSVAMVIAVLGILKSGAAYVPVDLEYPANRVALMLRDSGARYVVSTRVSRVALETMATSAAIVVLEDVIGDAAVGRAAGAGSGTALPAPEPDDVAYVIYTSGSTGTPKGVCIPHSALSNFLGAMQQELALTPDDCVLAVTSMSFDISVLEVLYPLTRGARIVVADREDVTDGASLLRRLASSGATLLQATPSGLRLLMNAEWSGDPAIKVICGGEAFPLDLRAWLQPRVAALWNAYGPTETTVWSTLARLHEGDPLTIGTPVANTFIYIVDQHGRPVPIGVPGEIRIGGASVAKGYHNRPDITAERFLPNPWRSGERLYRTGDIGRWRPDGRIDYLGRVDGQVKLRGFRIEIGEIEAGLASHPLVEVAIADVRTAAADDPRIVAWVKLKANESCTPSELRRHMRQQLPGFMIPSLITMVDVMPLTPNGKVDRRALPEPFAELRSKASEYEPPVTATELLIAEIWQNLLGISGVGANDSFFELGGHSLLAMRAASEVSRRTGCTLEPRLLFFRTLRQLAESTDIQLLAEGQRAL